MLKYRVSVLVSLLVLVVSITVGHGQSVAESKIKNGKILAEKALTATGDQKTDYIYKAKREFERASLAEPENPWPYYWEAVLTFYLDLDSTGADKLYKKALGFNARQLEGYPAPWAYRSDQNVKDAFQGKLRWARSAPPPETPTPVVAPPSPPPVEQPTDLLAALKSLSESKDYDRAESLYSVLRSQTEYKGNFRLLAEGMALKLREDSLDQASALLTEMGKSAGMRSREYKKAAAEYDADLDSIISEAGRLERKGEFSSAEAMLSRWRPLRDQPVTPARGRLLLLSSSLALAQNKSSEADSALQLFERLGYERDRYYKSVKSRLEIVLAQLEPVQKPPQVAELPTQEPPESSEGYVTIVPPGGEIVKVLINTVDPSSGEIQSSDLWETAGPRKLKTGASYKLVVQKKQEAKAPKFIALAGILATFILVR
jgi:hypothetical protein